MENQTRNKQEPTQPFLEFSWGRAATFATIMILVTALVLLSYQQGIAVGADEVCQREGLPLARDDEGWRCAEPPKEGFAAFPAWQTPK